MFKNNSHIVCGKLTDCKVEITGLICYYIAWVCLKLNLVPA